MKFWENKQINFSKTNSYPIEKILEEILVLFSDEENMRKSARIFKFLEEFRED